MFAAAEQGPATVTRRAAEPLVLMNEREAVARKQPFEFAAQLIAITTDDRGTLAGRMADCFPWMFTLSGEDRAGCARDLVFAARAYLATQQPHLVLAKLNALRDSAEAIAVGPRDEPVDWLDDSEVVDRP